MWSGSQRKDHGKEWKTQSQGKAQRNKLSIFLHATSFPGLSLLLLSRGKRGNPGNAIAFPWPLAQRLPQNIPRSAWVRGGDVVVFSLCRINLGKFTWYNMSNLGTCLSGACFIKFRADGIFKHALVLNIKGYMRAQRFFFNGGNNHYSISMLIHI